jgi:hypothetical protein
MLSTKPELSALARVNGPVLTEAEIETQRWCDEQRELSKQIEATPKAVRRERCDAALALLKEGVSLADIEAVRAHYWRASSIPARRVAMMAANLPKERADDALAKFDGLERGRVHLAIDRLIGQLEKIKKCMNGGHTPPANTAH